MSDAYTGTAQRSKTNPLVWVGVGCGILVFGALGFVAFILVVVFGALRSSEPYQDALRRARSDVRVEEALGRPIEAGWFMSGSINTQNQSGTADLAIPISGPGGKATIHVKAEKVRGRWTYSEMIVAPEKGGEIDLLRRDES